MVRRSRLIVMLLAWLVATGSHWDLVQTFAWGRMIASYSRTMPLSEAIRLTFQPETMCGVCEIVADAKSADAEMPAPTGQTELKLVLGLAPAAGFLPAPPDGARAWWPSYDPTLKTSRERPDLRPPRAA